MTYCTHCGAKREGEGKYCGGCGAYGFGNMVGLAVPMCSFFGGILVATGSEKLSMVAIGSTVAAIGLVLLCWRRATEEDLKKPLFLAMLAGVCFALLPVRRLPEFLTFPDLLIFVATIWVVVTFIRSRKVNVPKRIFYMIFLFLFIYIQWRVVSPFYPPLTSSQDGKFIALVVSWVLQVQILCLVIKCIFDTLKIKKLTLFPAVGRVCSVFILSANIVYFYYLVKNVYIDRIYL